MVKLNPSSVRAWTSLGVRDLRPVRFCMVRWTAASAAYISVLPYTSRWVTSMVFIGLLLHMPTHVEGHMKCWAVGVAVDVYNLR